MSYWNKVYIVTFTIVFVNMYISWGHLLSHLSHTPAYLPHPPQRSAVRTKRCLYQMFINLANRGHTGKIYMSMYCTYWSLVWKNPNSLSTFNEWVYTLYDKTSDTRWVSCFNDLWPVQWYKKLFVWILLQDLSNVTIHL